MKIKFLLALVFTLSLTVGNAQSKRVNQALKSFCETDFMVQFKEMKLETESSMRDFLENQHKYDPYDVQRVQAAYDGTAREFNAVLNQIRDDFMNKRKIKYIDEFPDDYAKGLEADMYKLKDFYASNYQQVMADVTGGEIHGSALFLLITEVINITREVTQHIRSIKKASREFTSEQLEDRLVDPHRFRLSHEMGVASNTSNNGTYNQNNNNYQSTNGQDGGYIPPPPPPAANSQDGGYIPPPPPPAANSQDGGYIPPPPPPAANGQDGGYIPPPPPPPANGQDGGYIPPPPPPPSTTDQTFGSSIKVPIPPKKKKEKKGN